MKRFLCLFLSFIMILLITSCSAPAEVSNEKTDDSSKAEVNIDETEEITESYLSVTDVTGKTLGTAKATLEADGFIVVTVEENSDTVEEGLVIRQEPTLENNLKLKKGDTVTLYISKGKLEDEKVYLDTMTYNEFNNPDSPKNNFSSFSGEDRHENQCTRAIKYYITGNGSDVSDEVFDKGKTSYTVSYLINGKYKTLNTELTGAPNFDNYMEVGINIYGDKKLLYGMTVTEETKPLPLNIDVKGINKLTIEITSTTGHGTNANQGAVILNNAYFE